MATMIVVLSNSSMSATNFYESLSSQISRLGQAIENVDNIPVIGKLTNVLPMAVLAASLKECPLQTMMVLAVLSGYLLSQNSAVQDMMEHYELMNNVPWVNRNNNKKQQRIDESVFVFDGDDEDESSESELLDSDLGEQDHENKSACNAQQLFL